MKRNAAALALLLALWSVTLEKRAKWRTLKTVLSMETPVAAVKEEKALMAEREAYESKIASEKERQNELKEQEAYQQTDSYKKDLARDAGMVMKDEILLREADEE